VAVQVLAGPVVAHGGARVGVPGGDLDVAQVDAGVETGRDKCVTLMSGLPKMMSTRPAEFGL